MQEQDSSSVLKELFKVGRQADQLDKDRAEVFESLLKASGVGYVCGPSSGPHTAVWGFDAGACEGN